MRSTLVDSNVLIDLFDENSEWRDWSEAIVSDLGSRGTLVINPIVFAEVRYRYYFPKLRIISP
jgi:predicted nucleic acid-binding protein